MNECIYVHTWSTHSIYATTSLAEACAQHVATLFSFRLKLKLRLLQYQSPSTRARSGNMHGGKQMTIASALYNRDDVAGEPRDVVESQGGDGSTDTFGQLGTPDYALLDMASRTPYACINTALWTARVCNPGLAAAYALWWRSQQRCRATEQPTDGPVHILPDCRSCGMGTGSFCEHCNMPLCTRCCEAFDDCCFACCRQDARIGARMPGSGR